MQVPRECPGVPTKMLLPETQWDDENAFVDNICKLGDMFGRNFEKFKEGGPGMLPQVRACAVAGLDTQLRGVSPHTRAPRCMRLPHQGHSSPRCERQELVDEIMQAAPVVEDLMGQPSPQPSPR